MLLRAERLINRFSDLLGTISAVLFVLMMFNVFVNVILRYTMNVSSIASQEMEWHLFATMFMLGIPYTLRHDGHVRVDLVYERLPNHLKDWIDILGGLLLLMPFCILIVWYGLDFAKESWMLNETSGDPGGLPYRWIIKSMISFTFFATAIAGIGMILGSVNELRGVKHDHTRKVTL